MCYHYPEWHLSPTLLLKGDGWLLWLIWVTWANVHTIEGMWGSGRFQGCPRPRRGQICPRPSVVHVPIFHPAHASFCQGLAGTRTTCQVHLGHWPLGPGCPFPTRGRGRKPSSRGARGEQPLSPHLPSPPSTAPCTSAAYGEAHAHTQGLSILVVVFMVLSKLTLVISKQIWRSYRPCCYYLTAYKMYTKCTQRLDMLNVYTHTHTHNLITSMGNQFLNLFRSPIWWMYIIIFTDDRLVLLICHLEKIHITHKTNIRSPSLS